MAARPAPLSYLIEPESGVVDPSHWLDGPVHLSHRRRGLVTRLASSVAGTCSRPAVTSFPKVFDYVCPCSSLAHLSFCDLAAALSIRRPPSGCSRGAAHLLGRRPVRPVGRRSLAAGQIRPASFVHDLRVATTVGSCADPRGNLPTIAPTCITMSAPDASTSRYSSSPMSAMVCRHISSSATVVRSFHSDCAWLNMARLATRPVSRRSRSPHQAGRPRTTYDAQRKGTTTVGDLVIPQF
jgi:hypothetical protein